MIYSIKQEFFKLYHKKMFWLAPIIMLVLMIFTGYAIGSDEARLTAVMCYDATDWITFILIVIGATSFSMEYQNNAILTLLYKASNKIYVYLSKYLVLLVYDIFLHLVAVGYTIVLKGFLFKSNISWTSINYYHQPLWVNTLQATLLDLAVSMLIITIIFLLSCLINSNAVVMTTSLLVVLLGESISSDIMSKPKLVSVLKWNPFNMLNLSRQYGNYATYHLTTHLSNVELLMGTLIYIAVFFVIGYWIFRKKRF
ncbi:ABC-2 type transport system permease protein [Lactobacillus apis]|uniref:ABC transporter permease n=1 Tax=Lactobacillus apis TaxID=303541 RepID=UPI00081604F1|nr:ABC transporter permease [Lactobacillus apis]GGG37723.1 membrane protein [Lactobacillus apis]SCB93220.1 ABC-2 type transport system permease protein [Lactobacillus apis]